MSTSPSSVISKSVEPAVIASLPADDQIESERPQLITECTFGKESAETEAMQSGSSDAKSTTANRRKVKSASKQTVDDRGKDFLTESEIKRFLDAAKQGRHGARDYAMMLMAYRHGLRVSELIGLQLKDLDLETSRLFVRRKKGSLSTHQPVEGDELRAIRAWLRERQQRSDASSAYLFLSERGPMTRQSINYLVVQIGQRAELAFHVHPHMLRHSCGYYLANRGFDTRLVQDYLGHKNIAHTVRYTRTAATRFEGLWE